ncbi:hypothetical protein BJ944DRAFT_266523 [Cunninghamella echinulata]|nr:hypothetical protein BJ944DRAFT_266523 [Cunninghamella echinulata]
MQPNLSEVLSNIVTNEPIRPKFKPLCENIFDVPRSELFEVLDSLQDAFWSDVTVSTTNIEENDQHYYQQQQTPSMIGIKRYSFQGNNNNDFHNSKRTRLGTSPTSTANQNIVSPEEYEQQPMSPSPPPSPPGPTSPILYTETNVNTNNSITLSKNQSTSTLSSSSPNLYFNNKTNNNIGHQKLWHIKHKLFRELKFNYQDYDESRIIAIWQDCRQCRTKMEIQHLAKFLIPVAMCMRRWSVATAFQQVLD